MLRETPRNDEDRVDAQVVTGPQVARRKMLGRRDDSAQAPGIERHGRGLVRSARLHLDEREDSASARDDVDLAAGHSSAPGKDPPAVQAQPKGRQCLSGTAALFRRLARQPDRRSAMA